MDLSLAETFLYLLMAVALFTSPVTIGLLVFGFFKGRVLQVLGGIAITLPVIAVFVQMAIYLQDRAEQRSYENIEVELNLLFPTELRGQLINGNLVGYVERYGLNYARYQFELAEFSPLMLDMLVPPTAITSGATIGLAPPLPAIEAAHLVILAPEMTYGPKGSPATFFGERYPALATGLTSERVLLLHLSPRLSQITYYSGKDDKYPWRTQSAFLQWDALREN